EDDHGKAEMADYVQRNNTNCDYAGRPFECHKSFHFTDVSLEHTIYKLGFVGTHDYDIVHAIAAATARLKDEPVPAPFDIATKKEALRLIAHFIGDLHQPLHVGSVYLRTTGQRFAPKKYDAATDTRGGNSLTGTGGDLHSQWDHTGYALDPATIQEHAD